MSQLLDAVYNLSWMEGVADRVKVENGSLTLKVRRKERWYRLTLYDTGQANIFLGGSFKFDDRVFLTDYPVDVDGLNRMFEIAEDLLKRFPVEQKRENDVEAS